MKDFFDFSSRLLSSTFQAHAIGLKKDENGINEHWKLIKGNYQGISFPVKFIQESGKKLTDILDTGWPDLNLISDRLKTILEENHLTGWRTFPIKVYDKKGSEITGYHGFSVIGHCSSLNYEKSEIIEKRIVPQGPICKFYKGLVIDDWDGSDFFTPEGTYQILVTQKTADILKKNKITNVYLENLADKEVNFDNVLKHRGNQTNG